MKASELCPFPPKENFFPHADRPKCERRGVLLFYAGLGESVELACRVDAFPRDALRHEWAFVSDNGRRTDLMGDRFVFVITRLGTIVVLECIIARQERERRVVFVQGLFDAGFWQGPVQGGQRGRLARGAVRL